MKYYNTNRPISSYKVDKQQQKFLNRFYAMSLEERKAEIKHKGYYNTLYEMGQVDLNAPQIKLQYRRK